MNSNMVLPMAKCFSLSVCIIVLNLILASPQHVLQTERFSRVDTGHELQLNCAEKLITWNAADPFFFEKAGQTISIRYKLKNAENDELICETDIAMGNCEMPKSFYEEVPVYVEMSVANRPDVITRLSTPHCKKSHGLCIPRGQYHSGGDRTLNKLVWSAGAIANCTGRYLEWKNPYYNLDRRNILFSTYYMDYRTGEICPLNHCMRLKDRICEIPISFLRDDIFLLVIESGERRSDLNHGPVKYWTCDSDKNN